MSSSVSRRAILEWQNVATQKWSSKQKLTNQQNDKATTEVHCLNNNIEPDLINDTISRVRLGRCSNAQKWQKSKCVMDRERPTDGRTNGSTDTMTCRVACTLLKIQKLGLFVTCHATYKSLSVGPFVHRFRFDFSSFL